MLVYISISPFFLSLIRSRVSPRTSGTRDPQSHSRRSRRVRVRARKPLLKGQRTGPCIPYCWSHIYDWKHGTSYIRLDP
ncbi:hypothetical protein AB205_0190340 [Aquarana catesbeiana]|uniref:Uncharacterized protein n=1 Tax=Aquarana catesbeiana TaxID=8400 RepID=A0A2G9RSD8_AQUCT|nr:hypothetical protein AB205_0190340 [Aquarana catesbeiana]